MHLRNSCYITRGVHILSEIRYAHGFNSITLHCTPSTFEFVFCSGTSELYISLPVLHHPANRISACVKGNAFTLAYQIWTNQAVMLAGKLMITRCLQDWAPVLSFVREILAEQWGPTPQERLLSGGENNHQDSLLPSLRVSLGKHFWSTIDSTPEIQQLFINFCGTFRLLDH